MKVKSKSNRGDRNLIASAMLGLALAVFGTVNVQAESSVFSWAEGEAAILNVAPGALTAARVLKPTRARAENLGQVTYGSFAADLPTPSAMVVIRGFLKSGKPVLVECKVLRGAACLKAMQKVTGAVIGGYPNTGDAFIITSDPIRKAYNVGSVTSDPALIADGQSSVSKVTGQ